MGLFRKDNPAEKKLKQLTGGFRLSDSYKDLLERKGISLNDGIKIQRRLKDEIKQGTLDENSVESRLYHLIGEYSTPDDSKECPECGQVQEASNTFCINCGHDFRNPLKSVEKTCPSCGQTQDNDGRFCINCGHDFEKRKSKAKKKRCPNCNRELFESTMKCPYCRYDFRTRQVDEIKEEVKKEPADETPAKDDFELNEFVRKTQFLSSHDFNLKSCPECDTRFLKSDPFCFSCGASVVTQDTVRNDNLKVQDGKFVRKSEENDELSSLESLYNQTVKSKYAPGFKVAYILYLDFLNKNPTKPFPSKMVKNYSTTENKLKKQALEDRFIEKAPAISEAANFKVSELKEILKQHNLKVSGKKNELIERLDENLSEDELKKHFKSKNYQISEKGREFLLENGHILYIHKNDELSRVVSSSEIAHIFEERQYSDEEIYDKLLVYLKGVLDNKLTQELWIDFKSYSNAIAHVQEDMGDLKEALNTRLKVFLFDINNYSPVTNRPDPRTTRLRKKDMAKITSLMHELTLPIDELKESFEEAYNEVLFKTAITSQDSLIYLLKVFGGEDLDDISRQINESYSNPH